MHSVELLIEALNQYEGSFILVSHDRYFISRTANVFWEIVGQKIRAFRGTYEEYLIWKEKILAEEQAEKSGQKSTPLPEVQQAAPVAAKPTAINKEAQKNLQKVQRQFEKLEAEVATLQKQMLEAEAQLAMPEVYADKQKFNEAETKYRQLQEKYHAQQALYETTFETLMQLESEMNN
jgi:ATP-binding cassette subfamily F protein 3